MKNQCPYFITHSFFHFFGGGFCGKTKGQVAYIAHTNADFFDKMVISHHFITY